MAEKLRFPLNCRTWSVFTKRLSENFHQSDNECPHFEFFRHPATTSGSICANSYVIKEVDCVGLCADTSGCIAAHFRSSDNQCDICSSDHDVPDTAANSWWKKDCKDCPRFEIRRFIGFTGNSSTVLTTVASEITEAACLDLCLDTPGCRGASFNGVAGDCTFYDCGEKFADSDAVFYRRVCVQACERNVTQTCLNCRDSHYCPGYFTSQSDVVTGSDCLTQFNSSIAYSLVKYRRRSSRCYYYNCTQLELDWRYIAYRKTCNEDCPRFELQLFYGYTGNCSNNLTSVATVMTESACLDICLDTPGCRGAAYDGDTCVVYDCGDPLAIGYAYGVFYQRRCIEECPKNYTQTCYNCQISYRCPIAYQTVFMNDTNSPSECKQFCDQDERCHAASYDDVYSQCSLVHCGMMDVAFGLVVHRKACHDDCQRYELILIMNAKGTCAIIESFTDDDRGMDEYICLDRCLNTPGCRGVSSDRRVCHLHKCDGHVSDGNYIFYRRVCVPESENPANLKAFSNLVPSTLRTTYILAEEDLHSTLACGRWCRSLADCWGANFRPTNGGMVTCRLYVTTTDGWDLAFNSSWTYLNYDV